MKTWLLNLVVPKSSLMIKENIFWMRLLKPWLNFSKSITTKLHYIIFKLTVKLNNWTKPWFEFCAKWFKIPKRIEVQIWYELYGLIKLPIKLPHLPHHPHWCMALKLFTYWIWDSLFSYYYNKKFNESQSLKYRVEWFEGLDKARHQIVQHIEIM